MLQQILRDMYVDPDILAGLDDQQKQTLFCKMREEQVRRWTNWNEKLGDATPPPPPPPSSSGAKKRVSFLMGVDGEPWVWVMGEHADDKSIDEILTEEAIEQARKMAGREAVALRKQVEAHLYMEMTPQIDDMAAVVVSNLHCPNDIEIYCSVDELRGKIGCCKSKMLNNNNNNYTLNHYQNNNNNNNKKFNLIDTRDVLQEISLNTQKVAQRVALWEKRLTEERTCEIFQRIQEKQQEVAKEAEEAEMRQEQVWREQEKKAKQAEQQIREIARRAREEHRLTNSTFEIDSPYSTTVVNSGLPPGRQAVLEWYRTVERARGAGLDAAATTTTTTTNNFEPFFHGLITRSAAERLLLDQSYGAFLVRLSEKIWGYVISYRAKDKCKHYLINATQKYQFVGNNQMEHNSLRDLIDYHRYHPLTGGEKLIEACPRTSTEGLNELQ